MSVQGADALQRRLTALQHTPLLKTLGLSTVREAKLLVHRKTGNLGRSIHVKSQTDTHVVVEASANYAGYVERGTRAHEITPRAAKALRFAASASGRRLSGSPRVGAAVVFAKRVHHPGTKPYPFLIPGAKRAVEKSGLSNIVIDTWNQAG